MLAPDSPQTTTAAAQDGDPDHDAVVYDLDGTLIRLAVDWAACETDLAALIRSVGGDPTDHDAWGLLRAAEEADVGREAAGIIAAHERAGAARAAVLDLAAEARTRTVPAGVCSLNCEAACRTALGVADLTDAVAVVVGRDSHPRRKPHPGPLLAAVEALGATPARTLFVGDSASDRETAERAGTAFRPVADGRTSR